MAKFQASVLSCSKSICKFCALLDSNTAGVYFYTDDSTLEVVQMQNAVRILLHRTFNMQLEGLVVVLTANILNPQWCMLTFVCNVESRSRVRDKVAAMVNTQVQFEEEWQGYTSKQEGG